MNGPPPRRICYCFDIDERTLRRAILRYGLTDVAGVQRVTRACLGCRTCRPDVEALLAELNGFPTRLVDDRDG